jgi:hypothetical protein
MEGRTFGYLTAISREGSRKKYAAWRCCCVCGQEVVVSGDHLRQGIRKSCAVSGHYWRAARGTGYAELSEYSSWTHMRARCENPKNFNYERYGGRGIKICDRWKSFQNFFSDMGPKPTTQHTIERKNNDLGYEPDNCVWATMEEQRQNRRNAVFVFYEGERIRLRDLVEKLGLPYPQVYGRLRGGWSIEQAVTIPVNKHKKRRKKSTPS